MHHPTPDEIICYHCQQSAEKYLKAFIFSHNIEPDKTHDLEDLLEICKKYNAEFSTLSSKVYVLTSYAVLPRYPNDLGITTEELKI
jgi:HEPN domain-containing protein